MLLKWFWFAKILGLLLCEGKYTSILHEKIARESDDLTTADNYVSSSRSRLLAGRDGDTVLGIILNETDPGDFLAIGEFQESIYFLTSFKLRKAEADAYCQQFGGHLASVVTQDEYDYIVTLRIESGIQVFWIGVEARAPTTFISNFFFTDGTTNMSFIHPSDNQGTFPWGVAPSQPNGDGLCVLWEIKDTFFDRGCISRFNFICKIRLGSDVVPTSAPLKSPTFSPSLSPTRSPFLVLFQREFRNDTFFIPDMSTTQANARVSCQKMDGDLARIVDRTEYEFVKELIADAGLDPSLNLVWLGIQTTFPSSFSRNFFFTDGFRNDFRFIHGSNGVLPWGNKPSQPRTTGACVAWGPDNRFYSQSCLDSLSVLCRISGPLQPTNQPTNSPTSMVRFSIGSDSDSGFFLIQEYLTQSSASQRCSQEDSNAFLAEIRNFDEYIAVSEQIGYDFQEDLWLMYVLNEGLDETSSSVATAGSSFLDTGAGNFPWAIEQPDFDGTCVVWRLDSGFYDRDCTQMNYALCRSGIISESPPQGLALGLRFGFGGIIVIIIGATLCFRHYRSTSNIGTGTDRISGTEHGRAEQTGSTSTRLGMPLPESHDEIIDTAEIPMAAYESDRQTADVSPDFKHSL